MLDIKNIHTYVLWLRGPGRGVLARGVLNYKDQGRGRGDGVVVSSLGVSSCGSFFEY